MVCYDILNLCVHAESNYIYEKIKMQLNVNIFRIGNNVYKIQMQIKFVVLKKFLKVVIAVRALQFSQLRRSLSYFSFFENFAQ
jgi:hypothetical protein